VNDNDTNAFTAAVNLYPGNGLFSGNYALKFDAWINYPGNYGGLGSTGSTEFAICGINHTAANANWPGATVSDGIWFGASAEGGTSADYRSYLGSMNAPPIDLSGQPLISGLVATNSSAAFFQSLFPAPPFESGGAPGKNWVEVELRQFNNQLTWLLDGVAVAQRTNTSIYTSGNIMLGLMDPFSSVANPARESFVIFDNVRVENLSSPISFDNIQEEPDGSIKVTINTALGDSFWLERSTNLLQWEAWLQVSATNHPITITDPITSPTRFYRARRL